MIPYSSVGFRILKLRVPSVNRIFPLRVLTAGAISLFLNITGAIAPVAPVLNTPLNYLYHLTWLAMLRRAYRSDSSMVNVITP